MTLVISVATPEFVLQVSDRRLTSLGGEQEPIDDQSNKQTVFGNRMVFGYTGLARIKDTSTVDWLGNVLASCPIESPLKTFNRLRDEATTAFRTIKVCQEHKKLAFVGVGWTQVGSDSLLLPFLCRVSNYHDRSDMPLPRANDEFDHNYQFCDPSSYPGTNWTWNETGATPDPMKKALVRGLRQCIKKRVGPNPFLNYVMEAMRKVSAKNNTVGSNFMAVLIPKSTALQGPAVMAAVGGFAFIGNTTDPVKIVTQMEKIYSKYFPSGAYEGIDFAPNLISGGMAITNIKRTALWQRTQS
jgi:hypothetical protein